MHLEESKQALRQTTLFSDLNAIHLDLVLMVCEEVNCLPAQIIFHQDAPGDALYIIARGEIEIILDPRNPDEAAVTLAVLREHEVFGETILVEEGQRSATARARTRAQLLRLTRERMVKLTSDYPEIGFRIMRRMAADLTMKLRAANLNIRDKIQH